MFQTKYEAEVKKVNQSRKSQVGNRDRNEKIRTYNYSRNMITDHRIGTSKLVANLPGFFSGSDGFDILDQFYQELHDKAESERLAELLKSEP